MKSDNGKLKDLETANNERSSYHKDMICPNCNSIFDIPLALANTDQATCLACRSKLRDITMPEHGKITGSM